MEVRISLLHFEVKYKQSADNKAGLLEYMWQAAQERANIILTPEMSVSGYSFASRADIAHYIEDETGLFLRQVSEIAHQFGCYICVGLALRRETTDCFYNSAMVLGPDDFVFRYDKIIGEIRWSRPGDPRQNCCFETPWGRVGILICSDTYYALQARVVALQGADLLLVPANWPANGLDPVELWRARALENGMAVAACNRTGKDLNMSCEAAESCLINEYGTLLFRAASPSSARFTAALPLVQGRLNSRQRVERLSRRKVETYHSCYRPMNMVQDATSLLELPEPGILSLHCLVAPGMSQTETVQQLQEQLVHTATGKDAAARLWLLSLPNHCTLSLEEFALLAREHRCWLFLQHREQHILMDNQGRLQESRGAAIQEDAVYPQVDIGPARAVIMPYQALLHPENTVAASKQGCDLVVVLNKHWDDDVALLCGVRTISHLCIAVSAADGGGIWMRPQGHGRWDEVLVQGRGCCHFDLDTRRTRRKRFQDRVDFARLLEKE